ncbi:hypothetical protein EKO27_g10099 [Xylaria grammica]|uniref:Uncharacterized protein n=1 Tax=Xylaria grammica TaxID=363999 RepID=A0A439CS75_9PEZI|nr:hypothetical protein EKO27_g10099 [Xylaria grammica]
MAEVFGIAAGIVGIIAPAVHWTRLLLLDLQNISDAPVVVQSIKGDFQLIETTLQSLEAITEPQWVALGASVIEQSKITISTCTESCKKFRANLRSWTRHSSDGKLSWQDRTNVGFLKQSRIKSMSEQLHSYQLSLNLVISTATLHSSVRHAEVTQDIKAHISKKATEIDESITTTDRQLVTVNAELGKLDLSNSEPNAANGTGNVGTTQGILEEERAALQLFKKLLGELKSSNEKEIERINQRGRNQSTKITFGSNNYGFQLGTNSGTISGLSWGGRSS